MVIGQEIPEAAKCLKCWVRNKVNGNSLKVVLKFDKQSKNYVTSKFFVVTAQNLSFIFLQIKRIKVEKTLITFITRKSG